MRNFIEFVKQFNSDFVRDNLNIKSVWDATKEIMYDYPIYSTWGKIVMLLLVVFLIASMLFGIVIFPPVMVILNTLVFIFYPIVISFNWLGKNLGNIFNNGKSIFKIYK